MFGKLEVLSRGKHSEEFLVDGQTHTNDELNEEHPSFRVVV